MKGKNIIFGAVVALFVLVAAVCPKPSTAEKDAVLIKTLMEVLNQLHFQPQQLNDDFSKKVYDLYLNRLDAGRRFLTQEDISKISPYQLKIDDAISTGTYEMFDISNTLLENGIIKGEKYFNDLIDKSIDFEAKETLEQDVEKKPFAKNDAELREYWRKMLKFNIMDKWHKKLTAKEKVVKGEVEEVEPEYDEDGEIMAPKAPAKVDSTLLTKSDKDLLNEAREETKKEFANWFKRLGKQKRSDRLSVYINVITNILDPHTEYYEPIEKENFDISMSGRLEGIGARLQTTPDGDQTKVSDIVTGGPAWKQKDLEAEDIILKVTQDGQKPVDIAGMEINEVVQQIRGPKGTKVTLTVRKKIDSSVKDITIVRDEVIMDEGYAKSLILTDKKESTKIGYIRLPKFYADFENPQGHQCSRDVELEIEKLKTQNIKGIILDLRNNGGGSLNDVVKMSGLFIEKGPIVQVKDRDASPYVHFDRNPQVQYNGPLIIMVNEYSASASEIMAAAMQDYRRAIIVGTTTYGKGTVQRFFDLDKAIPDNNAVKPLGSVKLTIQKYFRINGGSTQLEGVTPDINMVDNLSYLTTGEKETDYPMPWTKIEPATYSQNTYLIDDVTKYKNLSTARMKKNATFGKIDDNAKRIKEVRDNTITSLNFKEYAANEKKEYAEFKMYKNLFKPIDNLAVENITTDVTAFGEDEGKKARNKAWLKEVKSDVYIYETMAIMQDLLSNQR